MDVIDICKRYPRKGSMFLSLSTPQWMRAFIRFRPLSKELFFFFFSSPILKGWPSRSCWARPLGSLGAPPSKGPRPHTREIPSGSTKSFSTTPFSTAYKVTKGRKGKRRQRRPFLLSPRKLAALIKTEMKTSWGSLSESWKTASWRSLRGSDSRGTNLTPRPRRAAPMAAAAPLAVKLKKDRFTSITESLRPDVRPQKEGAWGSTSRSHTTPALWGTSPIWVLH